jgi:hypothetical protein
MDKSLAFPNAKHFADIFTQFSAWQSFAKVQAIVPSMWQAEDYVLPRNPSKPMRKVKISVPIGAYCAVDNRSDVDGGYNSLAVRANDQVIEWIKTHMLPLKNDSIYFQIIVRNDGSALVTANNNLIFGSRWIAIIDAASIPSVPSDAGIYAAA